MEETIIDLLQKNIDEARLNLTPESRQAIDSIDWKDIIQKMGDKFNKDQIENLELETELLLCGLVNPSEYESNLKEKMYIPDTEITILIKNLDQLIFKKIQENLEKIINQEDIKIQKNDNAGLANKENKFENLPLKLQESINISNWKEKLYKIAKDHKLSVEQMGILEDITIGLIINKIHPEEYETALENSIKIPKDEISKIALEVNNDILNNIRYILKQRLSDGDEESLKYNSNNTEKVPLPPYKAIKNGELEIKNKEQGETNNIPKVQEKILNPLEEKIVKPVSSGQTVSDYSNTKTTPKVEDIKRNGQSDPYREIV